jgi:hypothetical protein
LLGKTLVIFAKSLKELENIVFAERWILQAKFVAHICNFGRSLPWLQSW